MNELEKSRGQITEIDAQMARLFEERMRVCRGIADYKREAGLPVRDPVREAELITKNRGHITDPEIESYYVCFLKNMIDLSCSYQTQLLEGMRVAYSGEKGAFAYIAARKMFPAAELVPCSDFISAYRAAESGAVDCAVLPIENSYAGEVGTVMDLIFSGSLFVNQVTDIPVSHCLLCNPGADAASIRSVISHPQALEQCAEYIRGKGYATESYSNTALAAQYVMDSGRMDVAAIASEETARVFGMKILEREIQDNKTNSTRFAAFSRVRNAAKKAPENENFILAFTVRNEAGALAQALDIIGAHGFNMRSLRSRPMKELAWSYYFYIEAEGNVNNANGDNMLRELSAVCDKLRLAGSYPADDVIR